MTKNVPPKKLIEVALPLPEINDASAYDKMPGIGPHPKGIHQWWARLPLPVARAVLFASVVDDPSSHLEKFPTQEAQDAERKRLHDIIRELMQKKLHEKPEVYAKAREEMLAQTGGHLPMVLDPFSGGGTIPLEAARLGFEAQAADLNPVAVLLNKCNLEIVPRYLGCKPVNPAAAADKMKSAVAPAGAGGLAEDVRYYGNLIRERALKKIGHLYPKVKLPQEYRGKEATVIAWLWARTVPSPHPTAHGAHVPLITTYWLSSKEGHLSWLEPVIDRYKNTWRFEVRTGQPNDKKAIDNGTKLARGSRFKCLLTEQPIMATYIKEQGKLGNIKHRLIAIVVEKSNGKIYIPADNKAFTNENLKISTYPSDKINYDARYLTPPSYGMDSIDKLFSLRQLVALTTFSDLIREVAADIEQDAHAGGLDNHEATDYAGAVQTFLALALDRCADFNNSLCTWKPSGQQSMHLFGRQAIPMVWDFCEPNIMGEKAVCWKTAVQICSEAIESIPAKKLITGHVFQADAAGQWNNAQNIIVCTDPPYYDNVPYAAISDFFYVWLRRTIGDIYPELFSTIATPKSEELTAAPERYNGDKKKAKDHFEMGFGRAFHMLCEKIDINYPLTVFYAFKQSDEKSENDKAQIDLTTGWETMLSALLGAGFQITATWPVRASQAWRIRAMDSNALASYIVLACRRRPNDAPVATRRDFIDGLADELPGALAEFQKSNLPPVDLAQASIGPGMAVFSRFSKVIEADGQAMTVRTALSLINQTLGELQAKQEEAYDDDTRWALTWFGQHGFDPAEFGEADTLARAKNTSVQGLIQAGIVASAKGQARLLKRDEMDPKWDPLKDKHCTVWEATQHLSRALNNGGEGGAAALLCKINEKGFGFANAARELAYQLFKICETQGWVDEAKPYNELICIWSVLDTQKEMAAAKAAADQNMLPLKGDA